MAVGDISFPLMHPVSGVRIGVVEAGVRYANRRDVVLFELATDSRVASVLTTNAFCAAPIQLVRAYQQQGSARYLLINTGNANAGTGVTGLERARQTCEALAKQTNTHTHQILPFSTGVIGEQLPFERIIDALPAALMALDADAWQDAALGIMTTDTLPKGASEQFELDGKQYTITGISKGAGMIRPNMATMLAFVATDCPIEQPLLETLLKIVVDKSFNRITIDGDTSTNDACVLMSTAQQWDNALIDETDPRFALILPIFERVFTRLAQLIVRDGEGATKFMTVQVMGGASTQECCDVAYSVAHSPLIKTAFFASDPNWGRILAAVGKAGVHELDVSCINVWLNDTHIFKDGNIHPQYHESLGAAVMQLPEITIHISLGRGNYRDTVWTCDLSYDYVKINADYRS